MSTSETSREALQAEVAVLKRKVAEYESRLSSGGADFPFLDAMERINAAMRGAQNVRGMLSAVLDEMLELFACDRAWLLYPCDPDAPSWRVPMERTRQEWPGAFALSVEVPMDPGASDLFRSALENDGPQPFDSVSNRTIPQEVAEAFSIRTQMLAAVHPPTSPPWVLGIHHCERHHDFTEHEQRVFGEISHRMADALGTLLVMRDLRESEHRFRTLVEHAPEAIVVMTADGGFVDANPLACELFGLDRAALLNTTFAAVSPGAQAEGAASAGAAALAIKRAAGGRGQRFEWIHVDTAQRRRVCAVHLVGLKGGDEPMVRGSITDITEQRALRQQVTQLQKMEAIGELAGGIAHDFNNQLTVILSYADLLRRQSDLSGRSQDFAQRILKSGESASALVRELLAFSRRAELEARQVDLAEQVSAAATMLTAALGNAFQVTTTTTDQPVLVRVDPQQLEQVLINLGTNARDAMGDSGRLEIALGTVTFGDGADCPPGLHPGHWAALHVADNGSGMDAQTADRAFEPFFTTKEAGKGTGLGLSTAYGVVQQSGGTITVESTPGEGTRFTVYLPVCGTGDEPAEAGALPAKPAQGMGERVLVVDDLADVAMGAVHTLREAGYNATAVQRGSLALEIIGSEEPPHVLLTDVAMPQMDGVELASRALRLRPDLPILFTTGFAAGSIRLLSHSTVPVRLLQKPYQPDALLELVRSALDEGAT